MGYGCPKNKTRSRCLLNTMPGARLDNARKTMGRNDVHFLFRMDRSGIGKNARRPVSRVLSRPLRARDDHSSGTSVAGRLARPTRAAAAETRLAGAGPEGPVGRPPLCGLAPGGVCHAAAVAGGAVRSYRTLSPLPAASEDGRRRSALCGTFPGVAPAGRYPAPCFRGARTFLPPALAGREAAIRPSGADDVGRRKSGVNVLGGVPLGFSAQIDRFDALDFHRLAQCKNLASI